MENAKKLCEETENTRACAEQRDAHGAIADNDLEAVAGGQHIEFGTVGTTGSFSVNKVKVINGSKCPVCNDTIGILAEGPDGNFCVKCEKCGEIILNPYRSDAVEFVLR